MSKKTLFTGLVYTKALYRPTLSNPVMLDRVTTHVGHLQRSSAQA